MKKIIACLACLLMSCVTSTTVDAGVVRPGKTIFARDVEFKEDVLLACVYVHKDNVSYCMRLDEFMVRMDLMQRK